jgi:hypothetical protein
MKARLADPACDGEGGGGRDLCRETPCESGIARAAAPEVLNDDQLRSMLRIAAILFLSAVNRRVVGSNPT